VNADGTLEQGDGFPKNVTAVNRVFPGGYCVQLAAGIDLADAVVSLTATTPTAPVATSVWTAPNGPQCPASTLEVVTAVEVETGNTAFGTQLQYETSDSGFVLLVP
jgi:hypothetical protein